MFTSSLRPGLTLLVLVSLAPNADLGLQWMCKNICWAHDLLFMCLAQCQVLSRCYINGCGVIPCLYFASFLFFIYLNGNHRPMPGSVPISFLKPFLMAPGPFSFLIRTESTARGLTWKVVAKGCDAWLLRQAASKLLKDGPVSSIPSTGLSIWSVPSITHWLIEPFHLPEGKLLLGIGPELRADEMKLCPQHVRVHLWCQTECVPCFGLTGNSNSPIERF